MTALAKAPRILVGVDFDDASASALRMAGVLASAWSGEITIVHSAAPEVPAYFTEAQFAAIEAEREQRHAAAAAAVRTFAGPRLAPGGQVLIGEGPAQDELLRLADAFGLIVVGTHRRHGPLRWWLGSVAEAVVRGSPRPVLVVPAGALVPQPDQAPTILVAGGADAALDHWVDVFETTFAATVIRSADVGHCSPDRIQGAGLIVCSAPGEEAAPSQLSALADLLKECERPVLFVPSTDRIVERRSS